MKNDGLLERTARWQLGLAAGLLLGATAVVGCDEGTPEEFDGAVGPVTTPGGGFGAGSTTGGPGGTTGGLPPTPGGGGTTGVATPGGGTTGGIVAVPGAAGGTTGGVATPGGTAGGAGNSAAWCKAKAVLDARCVSCHDGKSTGPMTLTSSADFLKAAPISTGKTVAQAVSARIHDTARPMPPRDVLAAPELAELDAYIAAGSPQGDNAACTASGGTGGTKTAEWPPPGCDELVKITSHGAGGANTPYSVAARQEIHPQITVDAPWGNETVQAIAFRPITDNAKVLHHWILYANNGIGAFLTGWAPGDDDRTPYPPDVGMEMPKGPASLRLDMHYYSMNETTAQDDQSGVEICIVKGAHLRPKPAAVTMSFNSIGFPLAPANSTNYESKGVCEVTADGPVTLMGSGPHAHKLATRTKFVVKKKNGQEILLLDHEFKFGEQGSYPLEPGVVIETGDTVYTSCFYTNPTNRDVSFGQNTSDEMCFNFAAYYPKTANLSCGLGGLIGGLFGGGGDAAGSGGFIGGL